MCRMNKNCEVHVKYKRIDPVSKLLKTDDQNKRDLR